MTAAEDSDEVMACTLECFRGFAACLKGAKEMGVIEDKGVYEAGAIQGNASRAQLAAVVKNCMTTAGAPVPEPAGGKVLVAYFSATGSTENVAGYIADKPDADLFELVPTNPYTSANLNYSNSSSRVCPEYDAPGLQDVELAKTIPDNWADYDVVPHLAARRRLACQPLCHR